MAKATKPKTEKPAPKGKKQKPVKVTDNSQAWERGLSVKCLPNEADPLK